MSIRPPVVVAGLLALAVPATAHAGRVSMSTDHGQLYFRSRLAKRGSNVTLDNHADAGTLLGGPRGDTLDGGPGDDILTGADDHFARGLGHDRIADARAKADEAGCAP